MAEATVWKCKGQGDTALSVDLDFHPGIYRFNLIHPRAGGDWGSVSLESIIAVPKAAFDDDAIYFPTQLRLNRSCRLYATLDVTTYEEGMPWEISIGRLD